MRGLGVRTMSRTHKFAESSTTEYTFFLGCGLQISGFGSRVSGFGFRVAGLRFQVSGLGFLVSGYVDDGRLIDSLLAVDLLHPDHRKLPKGLSAQRFSSYNKVY